MVPEITIKITFRPGDGTTESVTAEVVTDVPAPPSLDESFESDVPPPELDSIQVAEVPLPPVIEDADERYAADTSIPPLPEVETDPSVLLAGVPGGQTVQSDDLIPPPPSLED